MDDLLRLLSYGADRKRLVLLPRNALVTRSNSLFDTETSHVVAIGASINQWLSKVIAHLIDVFSSLLIVEGVYHNVKLLKKRIPKSILLNLSQVCFYLHLWVLFLYLFF